MCLWTPPPRGSLKLWAEHCCGDRAPCRFRVVWQRHLRGILPQTHTAAWADPCTRQEVSVRRRRTGFDSALQAALSTWNRPEPWGRRWEPPRPSLFLALHCDPSGSILDPGASFSRCSPSALPVAVSAPAGLGRERTGEHGDFSVLLAASPAG